MHIYISMTHACMHTYIHIYILTIRMSAAFPKSRAYKFVFVCRIRTENRFLPVSRSFNQESWMNLCVYMCMCMYMSAYVCWILPVSCSFDPEAGMHACMCICMYMSVYVCWVSPKSSKMAHFVFKCNKEDWISLSIASPLYLRSRSRDACIYVYVYVYECVCMLSIASQL